MFRKFARTEILEVKSAASRVVDASLDKFGNFEDYKTDDGFMYVRVRAISSRVNKNHDGWPAEELKKSFRTFVGKPIFIDHHNDDPKKARGVVVDAAIHVDDDEKHLSALDSYYASAPKEHLPPTWIELLLEVDAKRFPKLAKSIVDGDIDGVSMGCNVERSVCSHCANIAYNPQQYCKHITSKGAYFDFKLDDGTKISKRSYEDCYDIGFFELSFVFDPADETAGVRGDILKAARISAVKKETGIGDVAKGIGRGIQDAMWVNTDPIPGKLQRLNPFADKGPQMGKPFPCNKCGEQVQVENTGYNPSIGWVSPVSYNMDGSRHYHPEDGGPNVDVNPQMLAKKTAGPINRGFQGKPPGMQGPQGGQPQASPELSQHMDQNFQTMQPQMGNPSAPPLAEQHQQQDAMEMPFQMGQGQPGAQEMPFNPNDPGQQMNPQELPFQPNQNDDLWQNLASMEKESIQNPFRVDAPGEGGPWQSLWEHVPGSNPRYHKQFSEEQARRDTPRPCSRGCGAMVTRGGVPLSGYPAGAELDVDTGLQHNCGEHDTGPNIDVNPQMISKTVTAEENDPPQSEMTTAPDKVDTLRQDQVCPICGSDMEDGVCEVCNYEEPPEGFDNPDLQKAKEVDQDMRQQDAEQANQGQDPSQNPAATPTPPDQGQPPPTPGGPPLTTSKVGIATALSSEHKVSAAPKGTRINTQERPLLPAARQPTDEPKNRKTVQDSKAPVRSSINQKEKMTQTQKTADGATPQGDGVQADKRVDVVGVGGTSGDPLAGITNENIEKDTGDFTAPHTDTWSGNEGDSLGQQDPVTSEAFEGGGQGTGNAVGVSSPPPHNAATEHTADGSGDLGGPWGENLSGGESAEQGVGTDSPSGNGFPDHDPTRVDLLAGLKEEVGGPTSTFGSDDFHIVEPTQSGQNANELGGPIGVAIASAKAQLLSAIKVAEAEIDLGLLDVEAKFDRVAELEETPEETLNAQIETLAKVKTAGLKKTAATQQKTAGVTGRMPSFKPVTSGIDIEAGAVSEDAFADSLY